VLDARMLDYTQTLWPLINPPNPNRPQPAPQGYFYRVVSANEVPCVLVGYAGYQQVDLEVQAPLGAGLRGSPGLGFGFYLDPTGKPILLGGQPVPIQGPLIVMENVSEVFEKGINY
jgi:hypothetical protein